MATNPGFLEQLGLPGVDESAVLEAQRQKAFSEGGFAGDFASGRQARPLLIGAAHALGGLLTGKTSSTETRGRSFRGVAKNFGQGVDVETDRQVAAAAGISPEVLKSRRQIRKELAKEEFAEGEGFDTQISMARRVASIALKNGDSETYGKAIAALSNLQVQKKEFDKLKAQTKEAEIDSEEAGLIDAWLNGKPATGTLAKGLDDDGNLVNGLILADKNGRSYFKPFGEELSRDDPSKGGETLDQRIRRFVPKKELGEIKNLIVDNDSAIRKFDRVMTVLTDLEAQGGVEGVISTSGKVVSFIDNAVRNIRGTARAFFGPGAAQDSGTKYTVDANGNARGVRSWMADTASDVNNSIWDRVALPTDVERTSAAAQQYRANIMELAYMAARLAEPSNRGLSDRDIESALIRIAGDSSNPAVIMRRFAEMMGDSANTLDMKIASYYGSFSGASDDEIDAAIGGKALDIYRTRKQDLMEKHGFHYTEAGQAQFDQPIDVDVQPGEGTSGSGTREAKKPLSEMTNEEAAQALGF